MDTRKERSREVDVIVLMAGEGKRMRPLTENRPKALLCLRNGKSILKHIAEAFSVMEERVNLIPIAGHGIENVERELKGLEKEIPVEHVYNPFYQTTGPLVSLWLGLLSSRSANVIVINGDTLIKPELVHTMNRWLENNCKGEPVVSLCISEEGKITKDDMKVLCNGEGRFEKVGKTINENDVRWISAGVFMVFGEEGKATLSRLVRDLLKKEETLGTSYHWHNLANEMSKSYEPRLIQVPRDSWCEMDTIEEFENGDEEHHCC